MENDVVIRAEHLGKKYLLNHAAPPERYATLRDTLSRGIRDGVRHAANFIKGRTSLAAAQVEEFWALSDVNFEIRRGEIVGIIGRNGAGKSTLLKVLSRITEPTRGCVKISGRVASLLEVGTGFHAELTGRENIFLNGAILGMTQAEIRRKFDQIVEFAGTEKFLDTPVKRYSSGMYVRLAFAVAAHLDTEILIVDEVLSVGDAEFQKQCLERMAQIASRGLTILFVSHNMAAVSSLTSRTLVLAEGAVSFDGTTDSAISFYATHPEFSAVQKSWGNGTDSSLLSACLLDEADSPTTNYSSGSSFRVGVEFTTNGSAGLSFEIILRDELGLPIAFLSTGHFHGYSLPTTAGRYSCLLNIRPLWLASGRYSLDLITAHLNIDWDHRVERAIEFQVTHCAPNGSLFDLRQSLGLGTMGLMLAEPIAFQSAVKLSELQRR